MKSGGLRKGFARPLARMTGALASALMGVLMGALMGALTAGSAWALNADLALQIARGESDARIAALAQEVDQIFAEFDVAALVARNGHSLDVLLDGRVHDLLHGAVVAEMDHLDPGVLDDPAHDVDGRVVSVEERGGRHHPDEVLGFVDFGACVHNIPLIQDP